MKKSKIMEFDKASSSSSSGSDDETDDSLIEEVNNSKNENENKNKNTRRTSSRSDSGSSSDSSNNDNDNDSDSDSDSDDKDDSSSNDNHHDNRNGKDDDDSDDDDSDGDDDNDNDNDNNNNNNYSDSDSNNENDEEEELPLQERLQRREQKGLAMRQVRERKSQAIKMAGQRLAKLKRKRGNDNDNDNDDDNDNNKNNNKQQQEQQQQKKKKSKHAPTEVSSKRSDYYRRHGNIQKFNESGLGIEIGAHRYKPLDPRTSNLHGHLSEEQFEKNYAFLEDIRNKEIQTLKKQIAARKVTGKKGNHLRRRLNITDNGVDGSLEKDQEKLKSLLQQKAEFERRKIGRAAKQAVKKKIRDDVAEGKRGVYFLKRKEKRRLEMEAKLDELRKRGGDKAVDKAIEKRRKKNKSRDANRFVK